MQIDYSSWDAFVASLEKIFTGMPETHIVAIGALVGAVIFGICCLFWGGSKAKCGPKRPRK